MWVWWILCFRCANCLHSYLPYRMISNSYELLPSDRKFLFSKFKSDESPAGYPRQETIRALKNKVQSVEDNTSFYEIQFSKFQQRLKALEELYNERQPPLNKQSKEEKEDWKEMYYEENEAKQKLENELDEARQKLEQVEEKLKRIDENNSKWIGLQS